jgi:tetratricopeptide (TPR) repeat protein
MRGLCCLVVLALTGSAFADTIVLKNGRTIDADRAWFEGSQVLYEKNGGRFGLPRTLVERLEQKTPPEPSTDPDVLKARELLAIGDARDAKKFLKLSLNRDPLSIPALQAMTEANLRLGDVRGAKESADKAVRLDDRSPRSRELYGDALAAAGDFAGAEVQYRKSFQLHGNPEVERKLAELQAQAGLPYGLPTPPPFSITPAVPSTATTGAEFRIRYDGGVNEPLGVAVLDTLTATYKEYTRRLGFRPDEPVTVVLQTAAEFQDGRAPYWAAGVNDGTIRVPVRGLNQPTPRLAQVLRHELAHSFVTAKTGGNCPTWLNEGVAQWLEGGDPAREDAGLAAVAQAGKMIPLLSLEGPFQNLSESDAVQAYAESLSAVAYILHKRGEAGVVRLLSALGDRLPSEEALPVSLALSYPEFQKSWEEQLLTLTPKR